jgi:hypothetical protein
MQEINEQVEERKLIKAIYWAGVFIWAGLVFGADSLGVLPIIGEVDAWSWIFSGAGLYALLIGMIRIISPDWSTPTLPDYLWTAFMLTIGLGSILNVDIAVPVILVIIGVVVLGDMLLSRH